MTNKVTIKDVARCAGVSMSTVSQILNGKEQRFSSDTRRRVLQARDELGYVPDFNSRNLIIAAVILVCALGFNSVGGITFAIAGVNINLSGLAIAAIAGILLNAILPGNDYEFDEGSNEPESASLRV